MYQTMSTELDTTSPLGLFVVLKINNWTDNFIEKLLLY